MNTIKIFISCNENINVNKKKVDPDLIFFTAQRSENISFIFSLVKYAFYFINNSLYFITLYIINEFKVSLLYIINDILTSKPRSHTLPQRLTVCRINQ